MLGFGALGEFALGEGPTSASTPPPTTVYTTFSASAVPIRKGLAVAVIATTFAGFVPPPAQAAIGPFSKFSQPLPNRINLSDEQPSPLFEVLPPQSFTPVFARFGEPLQRRLQPQSFSNAPLFQFVQPYVFCQFSQPQFNKLTLPDEQPSALFEVLPPPTPLFTGFAEFSDAWTIKKFNVSLFTTFNFTPFVITPDTHDIVFLDDRKKRKKHKQPNLIQQELDERQKRREAIELAAYGPVVEYSLPEYTPEQKPQPKADVNGLAQVILARRQEDEANRQMKIRQAEEDEFENLLKDLL